MQTCNDLVPAGHGNDFVRVTQVPLFSLAGTLKVNATISGIVDVRAVAIDRCVPGQLHVFGDSELIWHAFNQKVVTLELLDIKIRTPVMGQHKMSGALVVSTEPLYRAMARHAKMLNQN